MEISTNSATAPQEEVKLCTNCAFSGTNASKSLELYKCYAPENFDRINLVDGSKMYKVSYCKESRYGILSFDKLITYCGVEGKWFKPKPVYDDLSVTTTARIPSTQVKVNLKKPSLADELGM